MARNTNNSNKSANNNAGTNNNTREGVEAVDATNNDTLPQPAPAPNIQETAATDNDFVSQHEFNLLRDRLSNVEANMTGSMNALNNSIVDAIAQLSARFDSVANDLRSEFANGLRSVTADASRTAPTGS